MENRRQTAEGSIEDFLAGVPLAVVGASSLRHKYGNKVFRVCVQSGREVWPVNPRADEVEGHRCFASLSDLPSVPHGISIITPPKITEQVVEEAIGLGIGHIWMQPGAESEPAITKAVEAGVNCIAGGPCILVVLGFRE